MSYKALYRKWRPKNFEDVYGQDHIVKTLTNQIKTGRIAHAYLFCGTRGTGKTSTAKIFAKAVNCEHPIEGNACNECIACEHISNNQSMNIIEIDAASNNGVDNIREIREEVKYTPTEGKYKVYIIDEVHMLSIGAFNALLKTLEEPPKHAIFILATTEPHKIPITILSRCQRYDFRRISIEVITGRLIYYMQEEGILVQEKAMRYVAKVADGSMRDAMSILDQCIAFYFGEEITIEKVLDVVGAVDTTVYLEIIEAIHEKDVKGCMDIIDKISMQGRDFAQFILDVIDHLRNILIVKSMDNADNILDISKEYLATIKEQGLKLDENEIILYIKAFSALEAKIKYISQKRVMVEVELMKLCRPSVNFSNEGLLERIRLLEEKIEKGIIVNTETHTTLPKEEEIEIKKTINPDAIPQDIKKAISKFNVLIDSMSGMEKAILKKVTPAYLEDEYLYIICENAVQKERLLLEENIDAMNNSLEKIHKKKFHLKILTEKEYNMLAHETKDTTTGVDEAKGIFDEIKAKINFDIQKI